MYYLDVRQGFKASVPRKIISAMQHVPMMVPVVIICHRQHFFCSLEKFGSPSTVGERILGSVIAPEGSGKTARLLSASQRVKDSLLYYTLEYTVQSSAFFRHNVSVYVAYDDNLFSLNAQTPERVWPKVEKSFIMMAHSFVVVQNVGGAPKQDVPKML